MIKTADEFEWTFHCPGDPNQGYAVAMVHGLAPEALLEKLGTRPTDPPRITGAGRLYEHWMEDMDMAQVVGVFTVDGWAVAFEPSADLLADPDRLQALSAGTRLVAHDTNINGHDHFYWMENGTLRLRLKPFSPEEREGTDADELVDAMRAIGFAFAEDEGEHDSIAKAFALAEHITGVPLTEETFEESVYLLGGV
jgi:hypothetical protein